jgi:protein CLEC16A
MEDDIATQKNISTWSSVLASSISVLQARQLRTASQKEGNLQSDKEKRELDRAFQMIAALKHVVVASKIDDDMVTEEVVSEQALRTAQKMESIAVQIIYDIGDIIINAERPSSEATMELRSDDVFAYFCEKATLSMLVEIVIDRPVSSTTSHSTYSNSFNGVAWSPKVKAQIFKTVTLLLSKVRDRSAIYYLLSQHCMNQLIVHLLPLSQWTESALQIMLYPYIEFLKILSMHLSGSPELFPLYTVAVQTREHHQNNSKSAVVLSFPLFTSIVKLTTSSYVHLDSYIYATCVNVVVGLLKISDPSIRSWISTYSDMEQEQLCTHLTQLSKEQYCRMVNLATGPVVDAERSKSMAVQLDIFNDQLDIYNDIFYCSIRTLNVRLCEKLLQEFIRCILQHLVPGPNQKFFQVGISDRDVIPLRESRLQVAILLLSRLFSKVEYGPFVRMMAVTLFHPKSTSLWQLKETKGHDLMLALNQIVEDDKSVDSIPNLVRSETLKILSGEYGEWLMIGVSNLFENALTAIDNETLSKLNLLPSIVTHESRHEDSVDSLERALTSFFNQQHEYKSIVSTIALGCMTVLAVKYIITSSTFVHYSRKGSHRFNLYYRTSTLVSSIDTSMRYFCNETLQALDLHKANDITTSFIESIVRSRYKYTVSTPKRKVTSKAQNKSYVYSLYPYGPASYCKGPDPIIRKLPGPSRNEIEVSRFHITMALHFRAVCRILRRLYLEELQSHGSQHGAGVVPVSISDFELIDEAEELSSIFSCLQEKPAVGTDIDLHGRMKFNFTVPGPHGESASVEGQAQRMRSLSEDIMLRDTSDLVIVLDATNILVVRPIIPQTNIKSTPLVTERGVIICHIPLSDVIAAACDDIRLHIAVRYKNIGCLIRNGNMIVTLDSPGTCLIVHQYLEKCRKMLREELHIKIIKLFSTYDPIVSDSKAQLQREIVDDLEIPQAKTL